jgi:hypothetical protein
MQHLNRNLARKEESRHEYVMLLIEAHGRLTPEQISFISGFDPHYVSGAARRLLASGRLMIESDGTLYKP